ncbi:MAG: hypothetical protein Q7U31_08360, partial [Anaerolineaceae bacterium]|nr:hypothetical protein [Anaerolineaceae bacterium]
RSYHSLHANTYFWRTYQQQEIDLIEDYEGRLHGIEFKWSAKNKVTSPSGWRASYPDAEFRVINPENYLDFVLP